MANKIKMGLAATEGKDYYSEQTMNIYFLMFKRLKWTLVD